MSPKPDSNPNIRNSYSCYSKPRSLSAGAMLKQPDDNNSKNVLVEKTSSMHTTIITRKGDDNKSVTESVPLMRRNNVNNNRRRVRSESRRSSIEKELKILSNPSFPQDAPSNECVLQGFTKQEEMTLINNEIKLAKGPFLSQRLQAIKGKVMKQLVIKKRDFLKSRATAIDQQNKLISQLAAIKSLEAHIGQTSASEELGEIRIVTVPGWPAHDILLLIHDGHSTIHFDSQFAPHTLVMIYTQLDAIPTEMRSVGEIIIKQFTDLLSQLRTGPSSASNNNIADKRSSSILKLFEFETEKLKTLIANTVECFQTKISRVLLLAKSAWLDRDNLIKKYDKKQDEILELKSQIEDKCNEQQSNVKLYHNPKTSNMIMQTLAVELRKERSAREALKQSKESPAESTIKAARSRIRLLEKQLREKNDLVNNQRKQHDLQTRTKKPESVVSLRRGGTVSKTANNNKILEEAMAAARLAKSQLEDVMEQNALLQEKLDKAEQDRFAVEQSHTPLLDKISNLEQELKALRERSEKLVDVERQIFIDAVPTKEREPTSKETEIWKELRDTREALMKTKEDLNHYRNEKVKLLEKYGSMLQENVGSGENGSPETLAVELINKEKQIMELYQIIERHRENEKKMEKTIVDYKSEICEMRLEIKRLRNYDCYSKEVSYPELQTELIELQMKISSLERDRAMLVNTAASRAFSLERHERAASKFAKITRARRELSAYIMRTDKTSMDLTKRESARSMSALGHVSPTSSATWLALRNERAKMMLMVRGLVSNYTNVVQPSPKSKICSEND